MTSMREEYRILHNKSYNFYPEDCLKCKKGETSYKIKMEDTGEEFVWHESDLEEAKSD